jgi:signal transduction histidine kinase
MTATLPFYGKTMIGRHRSFLLKRAMDNTLLFYHHLSQMHWPRSYLGKMMLIAFIGVHVPLLSMIVYISSHVNEWSMALPVLLVGVASTVVGSLATMVIQGKMLAPILHASKALHHYLETGTLPTLPTQYQDEAGTLLANTQLCITHLDHLLQVKQNLLAILSHDLRGPITSVTLATELMKRELERAQSNPAHIQKYLAKIKAASQSQLELMNHTLTLVQTEAGKLTVTLDAAMPQQILAQVFEETHLQVEHKGLTYEIDFANVPAQPIALDASKTVQVLTNLVNNAVKFTPTGGKLTLTARREGEDLLFTVQDTGLGMDASTRNALFEPFTRAQRAGTAKEAGAGLGLWICKTFVDAQGGAIHVASEPGVGSCFTVRLPWRTAPRRNTNLCHRSTHHTSTNQ